MDVTPVIFSPVFDAHLQWVGLRLEEEAAVPLTADLAGRLQAEAPFPSPLLFLSFTPFLLPFPPGQTVLMLPVPPEGDAVSACAALRAEGVRIASPGLPDAAHKELTDIAWLSAKSARQSLSAEVLFQVLQGGVQLLALDADNPELVDWCTANGFHFIACRTMAFRPAPKGRAQSASRLLLMKLLDLVTRDAETWELEHIFRQEPRLAFDLLRLVNSASMGLQTKISSFGQAIAILGRRQLKRWLQLLMFAPSQEGGAAAGILMQQAAARGRLLELLSRDRGDGADFQEQAFLVGLFSLLDVLMGVPLPELLTSLHLIAPVEHALLQRGGVLGQLLVLLDQMDSRDFAGVAQSLGRLGISPDDFNHAQLATLGWVHQLGVSEN